jgi:four helix bundle protein
MASSRKLAVTIARRDRDLASQIRRALSSVALNLAEGFGASAGNARLRFDSARGSLYETQAGLRVAIAWGYLSESECAAALQGVDRLGGRVFGLVRPVPR